MPKLREREVGAGDRRQKGTREILIHFHQPAQIGGAAADGGVEFNPHPIGDRTGSGWVWAHWPTAIDKKLTAAGPQTDQLAQLRGRHTFKSTGQQVDCYPAIQ